MLYNKLIQIILFLKYKINEIFIFLKLLKKIDKNNFIEIKNKFLIFNKNKKSSFFWKNQKNQKEFWIFYHKYILFYNKAQIFLKSLKSVDII